MCSTILRIISISRFSDFRERDCLTTQESSAVNNSQAPETLGCEPLIFLKEPRPDVGVRRKTRVPCRTVPGAVVAWADDSRFSRRRVAVASERRSREGTKAVASVEGALGVARERAR